MTLPLNESLNYHSSYYYDTTALNRIRFRTQFYEILTGRVFRNINYTNYFDALKQIPECSIYDTEKLKSEIGLNHILHDVTVRLNQMEGHTFAVHIKALAILGFELLCKNLCESIRRSDFYKTLQFGNREISKFSQNSRLHVIYAKMDQLLQTMSHINGQLFYLQSELLKLTENPSDDTIPDLEGFS